MLEHSQTEKTWCDKRCGCSHLRLCRVAALGLDPTIATARPPAVQGLLFLQMIPSRHCLPHALPMYRVRCLQVSCSATPRAECHLAAYLHHLDTTQSSRLTQTEQVRRPLYHVAGMISQRHCHLLQLTAYTRHRRPPPLSTCPTSLRCDRLTASPFPIWPPH
jgi:hypothetical protein